MGILTVVKTFRGFKVRETCLNKIAAILYGVLSNAANLHIHHDCVDEGCRDKNDGSLALYLVSVYTMYEENEREGERSIKRE